jgi:TolB protein
VKQICGLVALAAMMLAACSSSGTTAAPKPTTVERAVAHGVEAPITDVPWSEVGPGWMLAIGGCGYRFLAKLDDVGRTPTKVSVPNVDDHRSVDVLGVYHGHFELRASLSCGGGEALVDYDPAAGTSTVLLGPTVNGGGVIDALSYPGSE